MVAKKLPYSEGDWFAVPLRSGGYGLGIVARADGRGTVLGYFYGPRREQVPTDADIVRMQGSAPVLVRLFGDLGILRGEWPIITREEPWNRDNYPLPAFGRIAVDKEWAWRTEYDENDIGKCLRESQVPVQEALKLPEDGLSGYGAVEIRLDALLPK